MKNIIIFGAGDMAKIIMPIVETEKKYKIVGLFDDFKQIGLNVMGYKVLGTLKELKNFVANNNVYGGIVGIGDNYIRYKIVEKIKKIIPDFKFITTIHASAVVSRSASIGEGTFICPGVTICNDVIIGNHCFIGPLSSFNHGCCMKDYSSISAGVHVAGNATLEKFVFLAVGAIVITHINIGEHTVIGAGSTVLKDIPSHVFAYGTPCKATRRKQIGEKYFN